jgi:adenylate kinase family enzyme
MYTRVGKVKHIDASKGVDEVFGATKKALFPQIFFMIGAKGSGKSSIAEKVSSRTNMKVIKFERFISQIAKLDPNEYDDEEATLALVKYLADFSGPRVLLEDFPRNEKQARIFIRNSVPPSDVFYIKCSKDVC